jgi:hypothetical protein
MLSAPHHIPAIVEVSSPAGIDCLEFHPGPNRTRLG